jgi:iron complex outermembrane receptor protein
MVTASASGRYDHYSDFGHTFNPKFGLSFKPARGVTLRGNWGTSFAAPAMIDQLAGLNNILGVPAGVPTPFPKPGDLPTAGVAYYSFSINGSVSPLKPQTAETWSVGADLEPVRGLRISASYFSVDFKDILGIPTPNSGIHADNPNNIIASSAGLTPAQVIDFFNTRGGGIDYTAQINSLVAANPGKLIYTAIDFRTGNFGVLKVRGLDFAANYQLETGFGSVDFGWNGVLNLSRKLKTSPLAAETDRLNPPAGAAYDGDSKLSMQAQIGANVGNFRAQATWNHTGGYSVPTTVSIPSQSWVGAFNTVNLFFKYDVPGTSKLLKDLSITLNVNNLLDTDPPILRRSDGFAEYGFANGSTLGRFFQIGVSKKF